MFLPSTCAASSFQWAPIYTGLYSQIRRVKSRSSNLPAVTQQASKWFNFYLMAIKLPLKIQKIQRAGKITKMLKSTKRDCSETQTILLFPCSTKHFLFQFFILSYLNHRWYYFWIKTFFFGLSEVCSLWLLKPEIWRNLYTCTNCRWSTENVHGDIGFLIALIPTVSGTICDASSTCSPLLFSSKCYNLMIWF